MKEFHMDKFKDDFKLIPFSIVYIFDTPRDQLDILNKLISHCIQKHVPLKKVKFPGPPAHWTKTFVVFVVLKRERDQFWYEVHSHKIKES